MGCGSSSEEEPEPTTNEKTPLLSPDIPPIAEQAGTVAAKMVENTSKTIEQRKPSRQKSMGNVLAGVEASPPQVEEEPPQHVMEPAELAALLHISMYTARRLTPEEIMVLQLEDNVMERMGMVKEKIAKRAANKREEELEEEWGYIQKEEELLRERDKLEQLIEEKTKAMKDLESQVMSHEDISTLKPAQARLVSKTFRKLEKMGKLLEKEIIPKYEQVCVQLNKLQDSINDIVLARPLSAEKRLEVVKAEIERLEETRPDCDRLVEMRELQHKLEKASKEHAREAKRQRGKEKESKKAYVSPLAAADLSDKVRFALTDADITILDKDPTELEGFELLKYRAALRHLEELQEDEDSD